MHQLPSDTMPRAILALIFLAIEQNSYISTLKRDQSNLFQWLNSKREFWTKNKEYGSCVIIANQEMGFTRDS